MPIMWTICPLCGPENILLANRLAVFQVLLVWGLAVFQVRGFPACSKVWALAVFQVLDSYLKIFEKV